MSITLQSGTPALLDEVVEAVASWQHEGVPVQVHPGDFGWNWSFGSEALAREVRMWRREDQILAAGMVDRKDGLIRMAIAPSVDADEAFAAQLLADLSDPRRGVLPASRGTVEARFGRAFRDLLHRSGWVADEPWTLPAPLSRRVQHRLQEVPLVVGEVTWVGHAPHSDDQRRRRNRDTPS